MQSHEVVLSDVHIGTSNSQMNKLIVDSSHIYKG